MFKASIVPFQQTHQVFRTPAHHVMSATGFVMEPGRAAYDCRSYVKTFLYSDGALMWFRLSVCFDGQFKRKQQRLKDVKTSNPSPLWTFWNALAKNYYWSFPVTSINISCLLRTLCILLACWIFAWSVVLWHPRLLHLRERQPISVGRMRDELQLLMRCELSSSLRGNSKIWKFYENQMEHATAAGKSRSLLNPIEITGRKPLDKWNNLRGA